MITQCIQLVKSSRNKIALFALLLIALWCLAAWQIADRYYVFRAKTTIDEQTRIIKDQADDFAESIRRTLRFLDGIPEMLAHTADVHAALTRFGSDSQPSVLPVGERKKNWTQDPALNDLSRYLLIVQTTLHADLVYVVNAAGDCIAASNWDETGSPVGVNFAERDFFAANKAGNPGMQYAVGKTTHIPGLFFSSPVMADGRFVGAVVAKIDVPHMSFLTDQTDGYIADRSGVVILAHEKGMHMGALPGSPVLGMSAQEKMARYRRLDFQPISISRWGDRDFPTLMRVSNESAPHLLASRPLSQYGLVAFIENDELPLSGLQRERLWVFLGLSLLGCVLIVPGTGAFVYLRTVRKSEAALADSEARLRALIDAAPVPFVLDDDQGNILYLNDAFVQTIGYTRHDIPTLKDWWPRAYPDPEYRLWVTETWQQRMEEARRSNQAFSPIELNIHCKDGTVRTFMVGPSSLGEKFTGTHLVVFYDVTDRKRAEARINDLAFYDPLTNLPNRRLLMERLQHALSSSARSGQLGALLFLDLDNFKTINDSLGHDIGDMLLQQAAQRLIGCVRKIDSVARLGGDEFVVLLEDLSGHNLEAAAQAEDVGEKIVAALNQPYQITKHEFRNSVSIGITLFNGDQLAAEELMKQADIAMYQGKKAGRNTMRFFDPQMQDSINARVALESDLRTAIEKRQFQLHYQIQVDSAYRPLGAEALIRWPHPERGLVLPLQFIPLAEETDMILPIGQWVLETAFAQLKAWQQDALTRTLTLSVNVSAKQFRQADFVAQVHAAIQAHGIDPTLIKLELTETMLLDNIEKTIETMNALNAIGIQLSLDDFGTGYSSLQYLKRLPLDQLKIDKSFTRDISTDSSDVTIVQTIIAMAHSLGLDVMAEGVETEAQRQFLLANGCTRYQGYLFSKPVPIEAFESLLRQI